MITSVQQGLNLKATDDDEPDPILNVDDGSNGARLQVTAKGAMYTVPRVFGLDEYGYDVGSRIAERSDTRLLKQLAKEKVDVLKLRRPTSAPLQSTGPGTKEVVREAAANGSALILWNYSQAHSTDSGSSQLRKRRQKLTDDLLRQVGLDNKDSFAMVSWWFSIFAHHAGPAKDAALPARPPDRPPDRREDRREEPAKDPSSAPRRLSMVGHSSSLPSKTFADTKPAQAVEAARLREKAAIVKVKRRSVDEEACEKRRSDLKKDRQQMRQAGLVGHAAGELDLCRRFRGENLDADKLDSWARGYDSVQDLRRKQHNNPQAQKQGRNLSQRRKNRRMLSTLPTFRKDPDSTKRYLKKIGRSMDAGEVDIEEEAEQLDRGSSAASSGDESMTTSVVSAATHPTSVVSAATHPAAADFFDPTAKEVMLRSSSLALLTSGIMRKSRALEDKRAKPSYDEVMGARAQILRSVAPVEISIRNLTNVLHLFGVGRMKAVERIARFLLVGVPHKSRRKSSSEYEEVENISEQSTLPFEVFYRLMKALGGPSMTVVPPFADPKCRLETDEDEVRYVQAWTDSVLLRRLLFTALTGQEGVSFRVGATEQRKADALQVPLTMSSLMESLKLMLCPELFLEVDNRDGRVDGDELADPWQVASGGFDGQLQCFAEFLLAELCRCDAACTSQAAPGANEKSSGLSYTGFEHFIACWSEVYIRLLLMFAPVAKLGSSMVFEELELAQKKLTHRAGELRAKAEKQSHRLQRRQMENLCFDYALPWLEKTRGFRRGAS